LRKYLDRFDVMLHMSSEIATQKRVLTSTETPHDLVAAVGKEYLEIDEAGDEAGTGKKVKRGRPGKEGVKGEWPRGKPGPRKGWKAAKTEEGTEGPKVKRAYTKRKRIGSSVPTGGGTPARG
jgi:hypothetical protein